MAKKSADKRVTEDARYHDTWRLLGKYRDVIWSMELSVQQLKKEFEREYGSSVDDFLDSVYLAGADLNGTQIENHARCIERSRKMISLVDSAAEMMRTKHKNGEAYYWILYFTYLSPQQLENVDAILEQLQPYIRDISRTSYFRKREKAVETFSSILWGYTSRDCMDVLDDFFPETDGT